MNDYDFGNFLCMLREKKGMTQAEIAQMLNVTPAAVSKWENGESKPRTDTLFQLAEILGVTAQELMAGKYIEKENSVAQENIEEEKINIMENVSTFLNANVRVNRIFAYVIDYCIMNFAFLFVFLGGMKLALGDNMVLSFAIVLTAVLFSFLIVISFILRDYICKGKSLGKRILGLVIIDKATGEPAKKRQLATRNLLYLISIVKPIDGIVMLTKGVSLCDNVAQTFVVSEKDWVRYKEEPTEENLILGKSSSKKGVVAILLCIVLAGVGFTAFSEFILRNAMSSATEDTVQHTVAYNYIITSGILEELSATNEDIKSQGMTVNYHSSDNLDGTAIVAFKIKGKKIYVFSHIDRSRWIVCEECTDAGELVCEAYEKYNVE